MSKDLPSKSRFLIHPDVMTTGQAAKACRVSPRTCSKWVDSGELKGYRIPGSNCRRILVCDLVDFMREKKIPGWESLTEEPARRVLIVGSGAAGRQNLEQALASHGYRVLQAADGFEAGRLFHRWRPYFAIIDLAVGKSEAVGIGRNLRRSGVAHLFALLLEDQAMLPRPDGFDDGFPPPVDPDAILKALESRQ